MHLNSMHQKSQSSCSTIRAVTTSEMALAVYLILTVALHAATSCCTCTCVPGTNGESVVAVTTHIVYMHLELGLKSLIMTRTTVYI